MNRTEQAIQDFIDHYGEISSKSLSQFFGIKEKLIKYNNGTGTITIHNIWKKIFEKKGFREKIFKPIKNIKELNKILDNKIK